MTDEVRPDKTPDFPRFLDRDGDRFYASEPAGLVPQVRRLVPATFEPEFEKLLAKLRAFNAVAAPWLTPAMVVLCIMGISSVALLSSGPPPPPTPVLKKAPKEALPYNREVVDAFAVVTTFENRVAYASSLAGHLAKPVPVEGVTTTGSIAEPEPVEDWGMSSRVALFILRNLPSNATFLSGAPAGNGAWALPSGDTESINTALGEGFDLPVDADVEMVSLAGQPLGTLRLQLVKIDLEQIAATPDTETPKVNRKKKRRHYARARKKQPAVAATDDAYRPATAPKQTPLAVGTVPKSDDKEEGVLSKFVNWLNSAPTPEKEKSQTGLGFQQ